MLKVYKLFINHILVRLTQSVRHRSVLFYLFGIFILFFSSSPPSLTAPKSVRKRKKSRRKKTRNNPCFAIFRFAAESSLSHIWNILLASFSTFSQKTTWWWKWVNGESSENESSWMVGGWWYDTIDGNQTMKANNNLSLEDIWRHLYGQDFSNDKINFWFWLLTVAARRGVVVSSSSCFKFKSQWWTLLKSYR